MMLYAYLYFLLRLVLFILRLCSRPSVCGKGWLIYWPVQDGFVLSFRRRWKDADDDDDAGFTTKPSARSTTSLSDIRMTKQTATTTTIRRPLAGCRLTVAAGTVDVSADPAVPVPVRRDQVILVRQSRPPDVENDHRFAYYLITVTADT